MKHVQRVAVIVIAVLGAVLAVVLAVVVAPVANAAVAAPTTSPAAAVRYFTTSAEFVCESGYACATVPYSNGKYVFKFYAYGTYNLSNWTGTGTAANHQTGNAAMRLRNSGGTQTRCIAPPPAAWTTSVNWGPVYKIQVTASAC